MDQSSVSSSEESGFKKFNDRVHGEINIPELIWNIILTEPFQRLKKIQQLGFLSNIFKNKKSVSYKRYEHCIGVWYMASRMLDQLENISPWIKKHTNWQMYRLAVEIAALLHDVGHGPYSHTWERAVENYDHEEAGKKCVNYIFDEVNHKALDDLKYIDGDNLIKALIVGCKENYNALPENYRFIFEIVNNKTCKLDVDRCDYLQRDYAVLMDDIPQHTNNVFKEAGVLRKGKVVFEDIFFHARVSDDGAHVEYRYEDYNKIYALFTARWNNFVHFYYLPTNIICDKIFEKCLKRSQIGTINPESDIQTFCELTEDYVLEFIKDDDFYKYIEDPSRIRFLDSEVICDQENIIKTERDIEGPKEMMGNDENFHFYGDKNKYKPITIGNDYEKTISISVAAKL